MKKLFFVAIALGGLSVIMQSCSKDWTCRCEVSALGITVTADTILADRTKSDAKSDCEALSVDAGSLGSSTCALK